jgi:tetrapyrrole methylase family protein / MazG family protein
MSQEFDKLVAIIRRLRGKNGCPWDRQQTHTTVKDHLLEELYELVEAIEEKNPGKIQEELGDLLLLVVLEAQIAQEQKAFTVRDVLDGINQKLIRRHPHIFKGLKVKNIKEIITNWDRIKQQEKQRPSILDGIPRHLPALIAAAKVQKRAARVGFDWPHINGVFAKVTEEYGELRQAYARKKSRQIEEELGDLLFAVVNLARFINKNPETALRKTIKKFTGRFRYIEKKVAAQKKDLRTVGLKQLDRLWEEAKKIRQDIGKVV